MTPTKVSTFSSQAYLDRLSISNGVEAPAHFDGFPVRTVELKELLTTLSKKIHGIKFTPVTKNVNVIMGYRSFHAYFEGDYFAVGRVGHSDVSVYGNQGATFFVMSRKIANNKYNSNREQFHTKAAKDISVALRNAKKYLTRYTDSEVATTLYEDISNKIRQPINVVYNDLGNILGTIGFSTWLNQEERVAAMCEFKNMKASGYVPETLKFKNVFESIDSLYNRYMELRDVKVRVKYVRVDMADPDSPKVVTITPRDINKLPGWFHADNSETVTYDAKDVPEELAGRIAVLQILNNEQYVDEVGYKVDNNHYFIQESYV